MSKAVNFKRTGELLTKARTKKRLTQKEVAEAAGFENVQQWSAVERGIVNLPKARIDGVSDALGIPRRNLVSAMVMQYKESLSC